jgi:hypothetical protein
MLIRLALHTRMTRLRGDQLAQVARSLMEALALERWNWRATVLSDARREWSGQGGRQARREFPFISPTTIAMTRETPGLLNGPPWSIMLD